MNIYIQAALLRAENARLQAKNKEQEDALVELAALIAAQEDALVELAGIMEGE